MTLDQGTVVAVVTVYAGDELTTAPGTEGIGAYGDAAYGAGSYGGWWPVLTLGDVVDFDEAGGTLNIGGELGADGVLTGGETLDYTTVDDDTSTIVLATPPTGVWAAEAPVRPFPLSPEKWAEVMIGDTGESVPCVVPHDLWDKLIEGVRSGGLGEVVLVESPPVDGGNFVVVDVAGSIPSVDGGYLEDDTTPPESWMDGSLYATVGFVDGGFVAGDLFGANVQMSAAGITAADADGEQTFQIDSLTGNVTTVGMFASGLNPQEAHVVIGDLAGTGTDRSFMYLYTGQELDAAGLPVTGYTPGEVSSGVDDDGTRYIRMRSPDTPDVVPGELSVSSSTSTSTPPTLAWTGDIQLGAGNQGTLYARNELGNPTTFTVDGTALALAVPNGTIRLNEATNANRLRSRNRTDTARRKLELEADDILLDVANGMAVMRGFTDWRFQLASEAGDVGLVFLNAAGLRVSNFNGAGHRPVAASSFDVNSDATAKNSLTSVDPATALQAIQQVQVYDYARNDDQRRRQRGVLAQDLQQAVPIAAVEYEDESLAVDLYGLATTNMAAIQALTARLVAVEAKTRNLPVAPAPKGR